MEEKSGYDEAVALSPDRRFSVSGRLEFPVFVRRNKIDNHSIADSLKAEQQNPTHISIKPSQVIIGYQ